MKEFFARKARNVEEVRKDRKFAEGMFNSELKKDHYTVVEEMELDDQEFQKLENNLLTSDIWERGQKGGTTKKGLRKAIRIKNQNKDYNLLVDPQGYSYPRYVAIEN